MSVNLDSLFPVQRRDESARVSEEIAQAVSSRPLLTFRQAMDKARAQVDLTQFYVVRVKDGEYVWYRTKALGMAESFLMTMGEIYSADPKKTFFVGKEEKTADEIGFVYEQIDTQLLYGLVDRLENQAGGNPVKYKRPYLRTVLYNEVFEAAFKETVNHNNMKW